MYLGIDCGTQSTKALIVAEDGTIRGKGHAAHELIERPNGAREQDPAWWVAAMIDAVRQALAQSGLPGREIRAIGVSGQQHGLVVLDEAGQPIRPAKLWNDTETSPQNQELVLALGGPSKWFAEYGIIPLTGYTISKLLWLKQNEPEHFRRVRHIALPHDYLNFWLTGRHVAECGDASGTGFFDIRRRAWAAGPLDLIDGGTGQLRAALPALIGADDIVGPLQPSAAEALGLSTDCLVSAGGGDNMMGAIGTGNVHPGVVTMSLGTSATVCSFSPEPVLDARGWLAPFCSSSGGWLPLVCTMNATNVTGGIVELLGRDIGYLSDALDATAPGAGGLTALPFLNGERTPDLPNATGTLLGLTANNMNAGNLVRAMVEGVSFGVLAGLKLVLGGRRAARIFLIGGGARSPQWRQLIADASGAEIVVPVTEEGGCLGGALQAMWAEKKQRGATEALADITARCVAIDPAKSAQPDAGRRAAYDAAFALYRERLQQIHGVAG
ncbi:Xylulose kinase [Rhodovastum atsumiense]|uniref:Xylulose kinase n=1 Tax=Rhodovastum atsumiense TaxID=504468 RepID=A0A5M6IQX1_9PROT|nr:xylulokinase [Rhodovastum atsumiense]KAA5610690.1 xylulokinase [Rhodovastum atsumiense]CAH2603311.1 Xylulose kinase [Rhodovastum atsumiense]